MGKNASKAFQSHGTPRGMISFGRSTFQWMTLHTSLGKEIVLIQKFLREHQSEVSVGIYDITVFKAIDQVRARLQKADKDLETIKNELSYKEYLAKGWR